MKARVFGILSILWLVVASVAPAAAQKPPDGMEVIAAFFQNGYWWDHTTLTVAIKGSGNVPKDADDAVREAMTIWNDAIAGHGGKTAVVRLKEATGKQAVAKADIVVNLHRSGGAVTAGMATCTSGKRCQVPLWESGPRGQGAEPYTYDMMVNLALHELGHTLGVGHAIPLYGTNDFMGYDDSGWDNNVVSACDMKAFDAAWAWLLNEEAPHPPTVSKVSC